MKKTTLLGLAILPFALFGQKSVTKIKTNMAEHAIQDFRKAPKKTGFETISGPVMPLGTRSYVTDAIGETVYDLQTNSSNQRRIVNHLDGTLSSTFIFGNNSAASYPDRGAGYNYFDGSSWGAYPSARVETSRHGWPALAVAGGTEIIISHSGNGGLTLNKRDTKGTGAWTESVIPTNLADDILWPRMAVGGSNDSTLHVVGINARFLVTGQDTSYRYRGMKFAALMYFRSQDLGATWDIMDSLLPIFDTTNLSFHSGDSYAMDARGNDVAITYFPGWSDVITAKSSDNGDTWTELIVNDFPLDKYEGDEGFDLDNNGVQDSTSFFTSDGSGSVIIDRNGMAHVVFGGDFVADFDGATTAGTSHFPVSAPLVYWNESFGADSVMEIATYKDYTLDDTVRAEDLLVNGTVQNNFADYRVSGISMPSIGMSVDGKIFVSYSALSEGHTGSAFARRHIYVIKSNDGSAWTAPADYTPDFDFTLDENVYPSVAKVVDDRVHIVYQRDQLPGAFLIDEVSASINEIVYLGVDTALNPPVASINSLETLEFGIYPNPTSNELFVQLKTVIGNNVTVEIVDALGRSVMTANPSNSKLFSINVSSLRKGAYNMIIKGNDTIGTKTFIKQ